MAFRSTKKQQRTNIRIGIGGKECSGKSWVIPLMFKNPIVYDLEDKAPENWVGAIEVAELRQRKYAYLKQSLRELLSEATVEFDAIAFDSVTELEKLCESHAIEIDYNNDKNKYSAYSAGPKHELPQYFKEILDLVEQVQEKHKIPCLFVGHTTVKMEGNPDGKDYQVTSIDLTDKVKGVYQKWLDYHGIIFDRVKTSKDLKAKVDDGERVISFDHSALTFRAKSMKEFKGFIPFDKEGKWIQKVFPQFSKGEGK